MLIWLDFVGQIDKGQCLRQECAKDAGKEMQAINNCCLDSLLARKLKEQKQNRCLFRKQILQGWDHMERENSA